MNLAIIMSVLLGMAITIPALVWYLRRPSWMGLEGKTFWNWLTIIANSFGLGMGTLIISITIDNAEARRAQELNLQNFIDRIANMQMIENGEAPTSASLAIVNAYAATTLHTIDGDRAGRVLVFLDALSLLPVLNINLEDLDFAGAELKEMNFGPVNLEDSNFRGADLEYSKFVGASFESVNLKNADLKNADLRGAGFEEANLSGTNFAEADLRGADLSAASRFKALQLQTACADETTKLPAGMKITAANATVCKAISAN